MLFASRPHNVTRLDAAVDFPEDAPPVVERFYKRAVAGGISLSRKAVKASGVSQFCAPSRFDGRDTGTLYVGRHTAEVRLVVYDKREEVFKKTGDDVGHRLRLELRITGKMGATLRDASEPAPMLYHFLVPDVLHPLPGVPAWVPFREGGFSVDRPAVLPYARLKRRVEDSNELARLVALADECGPKGRELLCGLMRRYHGLFVGDGELAPEAG
jgi:hypothetical protein